MPDIRLTTEQRDLRAHAARVAREVYEPLILKWDSNGTWLPEKERLRLADLGYLGITLPVELGGSGAELLDALIVIEELAKANPIAAFQVFEANTGPARVVERFGTQEQRRKFLPPVVRGEETIAVSISEPDAGSAATDMTTTGKIEGNEVVLRGRKRWCSGSGHAERYLVYCRLNDEPGAKGIGAVIVERDVEGLTFGPQETLLGMHGIPSADMILDDVRVPHSNIIVGAGGFAKLFSAFSIERLGNATMSLALGQASLDRTVAYVRERTQFGKPIIEFQAVQMALADMVIQVDAARLLIWRAAQGGARDVPDALETSIAKCFANDMAKKVAGAAIELHGGYGYHPEYHVERHLRDAHGWAIAGGTPTMQRIRILSKYLERPFSQRG